jgi:hypothetical protein
MRPGRDEASNSAPGLCSRMERDSIAMRHLVTILVIVAFVTPGATVGHGGVAAQAPSRVPVSNRRLVYGDSRLHSARDRGALCQHIDSLIRAGTRVLGVGGRRFLVGKFRAEHWPRRLTSGATRPLPVKDTARAIAEIGLHEARQGGKSFAQLYSTQDAASLRNRPREKRSLAEHERERASRMALASRPDAFLRREEASRNQFSPKTI